MVLFGPLGLGPGGSGTEFHCRKGGVKIKTKKPQVLPGSQQERGEGGLGSALGACRRVSGEREAAGIPCNPVAS